MATEKSDIQQEPSELVSHTTHHRNWRGIVIALVVIVAVCALIILAIILLSPRSDETPQKDKFTFEDFISKKYSPSSFHPLWLRDADVFYYRNDDGAVVRYNCSTNTSHIVMDNSTFEEQYSFTVSSDEVYLLLKYSTEVVYRHSTISKYKFYNIQTQKLVSLAGPTGRKMQYVTWSPTGHSLVVVQNNNIYVMDDVKTMSYLQVTSDGIVGEIFNGIPDWVYEEEVLATDNAIYWSPGGRYFAFVTFNDSEVRRYDLTYYGNPTHQYVEDQRISYPKAGTQNPTVRLTIFDTKTNDTVTIDPPSHFKDTDHYFTRFTWQDENSLIVTWSNRPQNMSIITSCSSQGQCYENYWFEAPRGWVDFYKTPLSANDGMTYFLILPKREGTAGDFKHIAKINSSYTVDIEEHKYGEKEFITRGTFDVTSVLAYDNNTESIYYLAYKQDNPTVQHLYRTSTSRWDTHFLEPECLSCSVGPDCEWVSATFSDTVRNYILACLGPAVPSYSLYNTHDTTQVTIFEDNAKLKKKLQKLALPRMKDFRIPVTQSESMWARLLLPPNLREHEIIQHSLLMKVYGGPGSQVITQQFQLGWHEYLASSQGIVVGYADPRGTAGRGDTWRHSTYRHLGTLEVQDTITAARYFKKLKYIKPKSSIWGWSYGGFLSAALIGQDQEAFKCAMAVAPVTDWRYYDSIYTERFMGLPRADDNLEAYNIANVSRHAEKFKDIQFLIVHGTGDDNVHFQNTAHLIKALTEANVYFRSQLYTDEQHSLSGGNTKRHLYTTLEHFLLQCYGSPSQVSSPTVETTDSDIDKDDG